MKLTKKQIAETEALIENLEAVKPSDTYAFYGKFGTKKHANLLRALLAAAQSKK